ncbi:MAG: hypothetical protein HDR04_07755 [Lachnospiraceae bacterium]|nr:hypothetical protein [Lachnospiraceae bacterium]
MLKQLCQKKITKALPILGAAILGFCAFFIIYGVKALNPTNDSWIMQGYDEGDIIKHYAGWLAFRNSEWSFPLGLANKMAIGEGTLVSYTDSIPWVAILFKILRDFLPETFQYFGLYIFVCFGLQAVGAYKILFYKTNNIYYSYLGTVIFCFAPIFLERSFRHTALGSHWLILFSLLFYFQHRDSHSAKYYIFFGILEVLAIGIHPYFLPMIAIFALLCMVEDIYIKHSYRVIFYFFLQLLSTYISGCIIGVLGNSIAKSRWGFGYFSMNLNALFNPASLGGYTWSNILKTQSQTLGNYDGFNYLGVGILITILTFAIVFLLIRPWNKVIDKLKRYCFLVLACGLLTMFAISNVVTFNERILFTIPLPAFITELCGIFRASSRMFYPVYYLIFIFLLIMIWNVRSKIGVTSVYILIGILTIVQIADMASMIVQKHTSMDENCEYKSILDDDQLQQIASSSSDLMLENCNINSSTKSSLAVWALKNGMGTYYSVSENSGDYAVSAALKTKALDKIKSTHKIGESVIVTSDFDTLVELSTLENVAIYQYKDAWLIVKNYGYIPETNYNDKKEKFTVTNFTDSNWENGISKDGTCLLFEFTDEMLFALKDKKIITCKGEIFSIRNIDFDSKWIHVYVDSNAEKCKYPAEIMIEQCFTDDNVITVANLTDSNWNRGVYVDNRTLLFVYSDGLLMRIWNSDSIAVQDEMYRICDKSFDNKWIQVTLDKDASSCGYPANLIFFNSVY